MKETPHLRITAQEAKELYLSGLFTTHAYLYLLIGALRKDGWWLQLDNVKEFCQEWGISERSFYRAKRKIEEDMGWTIRRQRGVRLRDKED